MTLVDAFLWAGITVSVALLLLLTWLAHMTGSVNSKVKLLPVNNEQFFLVTSLLWSFSFGVLLTKEAYWLAAASGFLSLAFAFVPTVALKS